MSIGKSVAFRLGLAPTAQEQWGHAGRAPPITFSRPPGPTSTTTALHAIPFAFLFSGPQESSSPFLTQKPPGHHSWSTVFKMPKCKKLAPNHVPFSRPNLTNYLPVFCDYCDVYLTHDSMSVRKAHNSGRNHLRNVIDYYQRTSYPPIFPIPNALRRASLAPQPTES